MPDRDIFRLTVDHGWKAVSRRIFNSELGDREIGTAIRAAAREFRATGCAGLDKVTHIRFDEFGRPLPAEIALDQLQELRLAYGVEVSETAVLGATRVLLADDASVNSIGHEGHPLGDDRKVTKEIIIELIRSKAMPPALRCELVERTRELTDREFIDLGHRLCDRLREDPRLDQLADQLLDDPSGGKITLPANPRQLPNHEEMLDWDLS